MAKYPKKKHTIALTGATGFVGKHFIEMALLEGFSIRALTRNPQDDKVGVTWVEGDLANSKSISSLVKGTDTIVHLAGVVKSLNWKGFEEDNVKGTRKLCGAVKATFAKIKKKPNIIIVSSMTARAPWLSYYSASKRLAENEAQILLSENFKLSILRPPAVYGPGDAEILQLFKSFKIGFAPSIGMGGNRFSMIFVEDLAHAIISLSNPQPTSNQIYELDDGAENGYNMKDIAQIAECIFSRKIKMLPIPPFLLSLGGYINSAFAKVIHKPAMLTHLKANEIRHNDWVAKTNKLNGLNNWSPKTSISEGFKKTISWYKSENLL